jgi:flavorubredoxin
MASAVGHAAGAGPREIAPGVFWLFACEINVNQPWRAGTHSYKSAFLVRGSERTALIDTGHPKQWPSIRRQLLAALDGRPLDYVVPTHAEYVHAGNLPRLLDAFPRAVAVAKSNQSAYHLQFPGYGHRVVRVLPGDALELGDRSLHLLRPLIYDLPGTLWAHDPVSRVLFAADGFAAHHHSPEQCGLTSEELPELPSVDNFAFYNDVAFYWTRYVDMGARFRDLDRFLAEQSIGCIALAHGSVVTDHRRVLPLAEAAIAQGLVVR